MASEDRSVDYTEDSTYSNSRLDGQSYASSQQQRNNVNNNNNDDGNNLDQYYEGQQERYLATVNEYQDNNDDDVEAEDATLVIYRMHKNLLHLMSHPELFHVALDWQDRLDRGVDPQAEGASLKNEETLNETEFEDDSTTFRGLKEEDDDNDDDSDDDSDDDDDESAAMNQLQSHSQNETFSFDPDTKKSNHKSPSPTTSPKSPPKPLLPLPHQIFASDAEVVLPQALTASQLFGIERLTGIELEAAAGMIGLSQLFLRWLALMPDGDHDNVVDPPGLTVMKISGGGYRVTGAHRVVWRWMNKFSPASTSLKDPITGESTIDMDFDFGDLVTMTIIDVFETDAHGKLLSYCPTFDNRAVRKTPEMAERLRKGASHLLEKMDVVARSPAGRGVNRAAGNLGKMSFRAAMVVGNAVKSKMQPKAEQRRDYGSALDVTCGDVDVDGERLNELSESQIETEESELDISGVDGDPTASPNR